MILLWSSRNGGLRYIRFKRRSELSGYELTGVDCIYIYIYILITRKRVYKIRRNLERFVLWPQLNCEGFGSNAKGEQKRGCRGQPELGENLCHCGVAAGVQENFYFSEIRHYHFQLERLLVYRFFQILTTELVTDVCWVFEVAQFKRRASGFVFGAFVDVRKLEQSLHN